MGALRIAFAALSWFLALGLLVVASRYPEKASGLLLMFAAFTANGVLHWKARSAPKRVAPEDSL